MKTILFLDVLNLFVRNFAVLPFSNDRGDHVGALFGCLNSINMLINKFNPDMIYCAWEGKGSSERRRKLLKEYKEGRKFTGFNRMFENDSEAEKKAFSDQLKKFREYISVLPFYQGSVEYLEADDLIAYSTQKIFNDETTFKNIIISSDRDYLQLLNANTFLFRPIKTKKDKEGKLYDIGEMMNEYCCQPQNFPIMKCITGDGSDAIEGIKGVGVKTVIKDFPILMNLNENNEPLTINDIIKYSEIMLTDKNKKYAKYIKNKDLLNRNYELMQLLDPNISLASVQSIERTYTNYTPSFNITGFEIMLLRDGISPSNKNRWIDTYTNIKPFKIML